MKQKFTGSYNEEWKQIAQRVKDEAGQKCIRCGHCHDPKAGYCLTVHHADGNKGNDKWWNLLALCQRCHLKIQAKVLLHRPWPFAHSEWFKPYAAGFYAHKYLKQDLSREDVMKDLEFYSSIEMNFLKWSDENE